MNNAQPDTITTRIDIVVHVAEQLDEQNRQRVEHTVRKAAGIKRAGFCEERQHLLVVGYDPGQISSAQILRLVRRHQLSARIIGGI
ncbi:MAG: hypothetical protein PVI50_07055 [Gammaproteobacteria bacterium]|jgi:hypothetical protein